MHGDLKVLKWFDGDKIVIEEFFNSIRSSHPSYKESLRYLMKDEDHGFKEMFGTILYEIVDSMSENEMKKLVK